MDRSAGGGRAAIAVFLIGLGAAWNGGNVGPIVGPLVDEFDVTLSVVGLLSGSVFCLGVAFTGFSGAALSERLPIVTGLRLVCIICLVGNLLCAVSPFFAGLLVARVLIGLALGLAFLFGGVFARSTGGDRRVGLFGAGIQFGIALALAIGGLLTDAGVDWRVDFVLSALIGASALPFLPRGAGETAPKHEPVSAVIEEAAVSGRFWRLELLTIASLAVPFVIGAWLVHYLITEGGLSATDAGLVAFALFGVSALARDLGGRLLAHGTRHGVLSLAGFATAAAGLAVLAIEPSPGGALVATVLIGVGLSLPYGIAYEEGVRVIPGSPTGGLGLLQALANVFPIPVTPLLGAALASGDATAGWLALATFVLLAGLLNSRAAVPPEPQPARAPSAPRG